MSMIEATEIEIGVKGQRITVRGSQAATETSRYGNEAEFTIELPLARELHRLLGRLIPLVEQSRVRAPVAYISKPAESA